MKTSTSSSGIVNYYYNLLYLLKGGLQRLVGVPQVLGTWPFLPWHFSGTLWGWRSSRPKPRAAPTSAARWLNSICVQPNPIYLTSLRKGKKKYIKKSCIKITAFGTVLSLLSRNWRQLDKLQWKRIKQRYFVNTILWYQSLLNSHSIKMLMAKATRERGYCNPNW